MTAKEDVSIDCVARSIAVSSLRGAMLFPDTGFITSPMDPVFWKDVATRAVAFPEIIVAELSGWVQRPIHNSYLHSFLPRALERCNSQQTLPDWMFRVAKTLGSIGSDLYTFEVAIADRDKFLNFGYQYYVNLLSLRKRIGIRTFREMRKLLNRDPSEREIFDVLSREHPPRTASIAFKGWKDCGKRNYLADEELVVTAVLSAILTGRESIILTRDNDVFDQFVKLLELEAVSKQFCY